MLTGPEVEIAEEVESKINFSEYLAGAVVRYFKEKPEVGKVVSSFAKGLQKYVDFLEQPQMQDFLINFNDLPEKRKLVVQNMSDKGWFPPSYRLYYNFPKEEQSIDEFMGSFIDQRYRKIKSGLLSRHADRELILKNAFELYEQGNYIACIPLLLTQIDGICHDSGLNHYFTDSQAQNKDDRKNPKYKKFPNKIKALMDSKDIDQNIKEFFQVVIEKADKSFISVRTDEVGVVDELSILNRHGILHGLIQYQDYGTKINAQKIISLMCYINIMIDLLTEDQMC